MKNLAENDGSLRFAFEIQPLTILCVSIVVLGISITGLASVAITRRAEDARGAQIDMRWAGQAAAVLHVLAAATAAAAIVQYFQFVVMESGSAYAVKKHVFAIVAFELASTAAIIGSILAPNAHGGRPSRIATDMLGLTAAALLSVLLFLRPSVVDVDQVAKTSASVRELKTAMKAFDDGVDDTWPVFASSRFTPVINYLQTVATLQSPQAPDDNAMKILNQEKTFDFRKVSYVITVEGDVNLDMLACRVSKPYSALVVIDASCMDKRASTPIVLREGSYINFDTSYHSLGTLKSGWYPPEVSGTWTKGSEAELVVRLADSLDPAAHGLRLELSAFLPLESPYRTGRLSLNGGAEVLLEFSANAVDQVVLLPLVAGGQPDLRISVRIDDPISPAALGINTDERLLGFRTNRLALVRLK